MGNDEPGNQPAVKQEQTEILETLIHSSVVLN